MNRKPLAEVRGDGLAVFCPAWAGLAGLTHGATTRAALPQQGKDDFFTTIQRAREARAIPRVLTFGADQVHEAHVEIINEPFDNRKHQPGLRCEPGLEACEFPATDALITTLPGVLIVIQTADCLPIFMIDRVNQIAGLAHCGWRGLRQGLAGKMAREMIAQGTRARDLEAWLGPCIQAPRYEVGTALVEDFRGAFPGAEVSPNDTHLDLPAVARWQLERAGIGEDRIFDSGECTLGQSDRYHSYRGEGGEAGRILSFIGFGLG